MRRTLHETLVLVCHFHEGIRDKAGLPDILHLQRVYMRLPPWANDNERHAALLHDIVEDTRVTLKDLQNWGYSQEIVDIVDLVTRRDTDTYREYVDRICNYGNVSAILVKLADNADNQDPIRLQGFDVSRYKSARQKLLAALPAPYEWALTSPHGVSRRWLDLQAKLAA